MTLLQSAPVPTAVGPPINAVEQPITYNGDAAASSVAAAVATEGAKPSKRSVDVNAPCAVQPDGYGPKVSPDTTDAFLASRQLAVR